MVEDEGRQIVEDESLNTQSDTTWCDTDSCVSASKCYCKRSEKRFSSMCVGNEYSKARKSKSTNKKPSEKLTLDYELFTIGGNSKSVQPEEALSVKKSVEAAAVFADVKLSQTTDIKSLCPNPSINSNGVLKNSSKSNCPSYVGSQKYISYKKRESLSTDLQNERKALLHNSVSSKSSQKSCSADDLLSKLSAIENAVNKVNSVCSAKIKNADLINFNGVKDCYQSMRAVSTASLEDTLGYLP